MNWFDLLAVQGTLKNLLQHHSLKASVLPCSLLYSPTLISIHDYWKTQSFHYQRNANQNHNESPFFPMSQHIIYKMYKENEKKRNQHTMRYHLMLVRMVTTKNNKWWRGCGEQVTLLHCWLECKLAQPLWRTVEIPYKTGNRTGIWPSNCTDGHTHGGNQNWKRHMYPKVHRSTVYNS